MGGWGTLVRGINVQLIRGIIKRHYEKGLIGGARGAPRWQEVLLWHCRGKVVG